MLEGRCDLEDDQREQMDKDFENLLAVGDEFKNRRPVIRLLDSSFLAEKEPRPQFIIEQ